MFKRKVCGKEFKNLRGLSIHINNSLYGSYAKVYERQFWFV